AEVKGAVVGTLHVRYLGNAEAWLEGVRVHPGYRRQGAATLLIEEAHRLASARHCRTIRLETGASNHAARRAFERLGYRRVVEYVSYKGDARQETSCSVRPATLRELAACWELWESSALKRH